MPFFTVQGPRLLSGGSFTPTSAESAAYLARTTGLSDTQKGYLDTMITGLVNDGVFAKLDALWIYANANAGNAVLNVISTSYPCIANGSPSFTPFQGYTGVDSSSTVYLDTQFNPFTASGHYAQNGGNLSAWSNTAAQATATGGSILGLYNGSVSAQLLPYYSDGNSYFQLNTTSAPFAGALGTALGHWMANRTTSLQITGYQNDSSAVVTSGGDTSGTMPNGNIYVLAQNLVGTGANFGGGRQLSMASVGGDLVTGGDLTGAYYTRLRTYMTAIGLP